MKKLLACAATLLLLLGAETSFADRDDWGRDRYDRHDNGRGWAFGRRDRDRWDRRDRDDDRVYVNLNIGTVVNDWRYRDYRRATSRFGVPYTTTWGPPGNVWRYNERPVIVHQNTYINTAPRTTTRIVTRPGRNSTSLFRDINGRCFERSIDGRGNETRIELPSSSCNF